MPPDTLEITFFFPATTEYSQIFLCQDMESFPLQETLAPTGGQYLES